MVKENSLENAEINMPWMNPPQTDLDGNPRIIGGQVDMGSYEFIPEPTLFIIYYRRKFKL